MRHSLREFGAEQTRQWFAQRGLETKTEYDGRVFPVTDRSESVMALLQAEMERMGIWMMVGAQLKGIYPDLGRYRLEFVQGPD